MIKRLFFGVEAQAPWPSDYPRGRILDPSCRHMTLAFLGNVEYEKFSDLIPNIPKPQFKVGIIGRFDHPIFLPPPPKYSRVVAWHVDLAEKEVLWQYQQILVNFLREKGFEIENRSFLPHVTICRAPFYPREWKQAFAQLPCFFKNICLYESVGHLQYEPLWIHELCLPFDEVEHTADIAFRIKGENLLQLYQHALCSLAFRFPQLLAFAPTRNPDIQELFDIVIALNDVVGRADAEIGCPYKAVSFHGDLEQDSEGILTWEMIVDV